MTVVQRTSSDLKVNPHLHVVLLDGAYRERAGGELAWYALGHLRTSEVGDVLERAVRRMDKHLCRRDLIAMDGGGDEDREAALVASAVSGDSPPAGQTGGVASARSRQPRSASTSRSARRWMVRSRAMVGRSFGGAPNGAAPGFRTALRPLADLIVPIS
jgi:hypothetical protein